MTVLKTICTKTVACRLFVNTQAQTHVQIPAYVQLPALFQPCVPSQPSTHLRCNQAPCPATISINPPCLAEMLTISHKPRIISKDSNEVAMFYLSAPCTLATGSQVYWKDHYPSTVSIQFLPLLLTHPCFNTPDPHHPHLLDPRSCDLSSSDYCSSMISLV